MIIEDQATTEEHSMKDHVVDLLVEVMEEELELPLLAPVGGLQVSMTTDLLQPVEIMK